MGALGTLQRSLRPYAEGLLEVARVAGLRATVTSVYRSRAKQRRLYNAYIRGESVFPAAPPGCSSHESGLAFDVVIRKGRDLDLDALRELGKVWESWGGVWGGRFKDPIHFSAGEPRC